VLGVDFDQSRSFLSAFTGEGCNCFGMHTATKNVPRCASNETDMRVCVFGVEMSANRCSENDLECSGAAVLQCRYVYLSAVLPCGLLELANNCLPVVVCPAAHSMTCCPMHTTAEVGIPGLLHFLYKSLQTSQITCPKPEAPYTNRHERKRYAMLFGIRLLCALVIDQSTTADHYHH
jgi:hypothetical protein